MQGTISFDGTLSGGITGGGGGSEVTITPTLQSGTKIADYSIDHEAGSLYAPTPEELPDTIVTKALRKYNDTSQTKIMTVTTYDKENDQEVSQDIYAPSPVDCWYTPGLEQDYEIGKFTYGGVTQNVYIPYFQRPLTAGANITIDADNVISASSGGSSWNYSTAPVKTGQKWIDGKDLYIQVIQVNNLSPDTTSNALISNVDFYTCLGITAGVHGGSTSFSPSQISMYNYQSGGTIYAVLYYDSTTHELKISNNSRTNAIDTTAIVMFTEI